MNKYYVALIIQDSILLTSSRWSVYQTDCVSASVLSAVHLLSHIMFLTSQGGYLYYFYTKYEDPELQRD